MREIVQVSRRLPLEASALRVALLFLALDSPTDSRRWTLGPLGAIELDPHFTPGSPDAEVGGRCSATRGRLCAPDGFTVDIEITIVTSDDAEPRLTLRAEPDCGAHHDALLIAARAGLDELAEELHFFGSRQAA